MPTSLPQRRPGPFNRWHYAGMVAGYTIITGGLLLALLVRANPPAAQPIPHVTTASAPAGQSGVPASR